MANGKDVGNDLMMSIDFNKKLAKRTQDNIDNLYKTTYYTDNKEKQYIDTMRDQMNKSINGLIDKTKLRNGETNISGLYARTLAKGDRSLSVMKEITDSSMLSDIMDLYSNNMVVRDMDREIDVVLKYVPRLRQAQRMIQNAVLFADHMEDDAVKITILNAIQNPVDANDQISSETDEDKVKACKKKYDWDDLKEKLYNKTSYYGEQFVYILSYKKALERMMRNKESHSGIVTESTYLTEEEITDLYNEYSNHMTIGFTITKENGILHEAVYDMNELDYKTQTMIQNQKDTLLETIDVEFNTSGCIPSIVTQASNLRRFMSETLVPIQEVSIKTDYGLAKNSSFLKNIDKEFKKFSKDSLKAPNDIANDGLTTVKNQTPINVPGCIVELLKHEYVKPLYINKCCLGYYYIESDRPMDYDAQTTFSSTLG